MKTTNPKKNSARLLITTGASAEPTPDEIALRAYSIWEQEGRPDNRHMENWMQAEIQLRQAPPQAAVRV